MNKYIQPILFGSLIALASSAVFAAAQQRDEDTSGYWVTDGIKNAAKGVANFGRAIGGNEEAGRQLRGDFRKAAKGINNAGSRVGEEFREFPSSVSDGVTAMGEDATYVGERTGKHAKAAGNAASKLGKDFATASTGNSEAERDAARKKLPTGLGGVTEWVDDMTAQHRAPDKDTAVAASEEELRKTQGALTASYNDQHTATRSATGSGGATSSNPNTAPAPAEDPKDD